MTPKICSREEEEGDVDTQISQNPSPNSTTIEDLDSVEIDQKQGEFPNPSSPPKTLTLDIQDLQYEEDESKGMPLSPTFTSSANVHARKTKRKHAFNRKKAAATAKKLETLSQNLKPIPFCPSKSLDFDKHEKLLKSLGLWDFVHIEFDRVIRSDLLAQLVVNYVPVSRCTYVNEVRIMVNRADLGRALKLPVKKDKAVAIDGESEVLASEESIGFVDDLVSSWILLHEDMWMLPNEVLNWTRSIKEGHPERVDWASLIWFMVEKELSQGTQLGNCYYASHLQYLMKSQREDLFRDEPRVYLKDDEDDEVLPKEEPDVVGKEEAIKEEHDDVVKEEVIKEEHDVVVEEEVPSEVLVKEFEGEEDIVNKQEKEHLINELVNEEEQSVKEGEQVKEEKDGADVKMSDVIHENQKQELEEHRIELSLGQDSSEKVQEKVEDVMDFDACKAEENGHWVLDGKVNDHEVSVQHYDNVEDEIKGLDLQEERMQGDVEEEEIDDEEGEEEEDEEEEDEEEEEEEGEEMQMERFGLLQKCNSLGGLSSSNLLHEMEAEAAQMPYNSAVQLHDHSSMELLSSRAEQNSNSGGLSIFGNGSKRDIGHDLDISHHAIDGGSHKRLRTDGGWDHKSSEFDLCLENIQNWIGKAKMLYEAKERTCTESTINQQLFLSELQQRETMIEHLQRAKYEEQQKKDLEIYRLERELYVMGNLLDGYRKALKETRRAFLEYRETYKQPIEPIYTDVGPGGVMLSSKEQEKQALKQEEENRLKLLILVEKCKAFEADCCKKMEFYARETDFLGERIQHLEKQVTDLKALSERRKGSKMKESAENEEVAAPEASPHDLS
ncbi:hypothetical protein RJ641_017567 [Dillenia turbinata]|uniref:Uncharacterized protein n=1 Tax=Dillenia turbinata TaxID=194707 RepID=A0AAN8UP91_9MAGN